MGTKNNPGAWDCYANAEPDEPMFVLLGRDPMAGALVRLWALAREEQGKDPSKVQEARMCARALDAWALHLGKIPVRACALTDSRRDTTVQVLVDALVSIAGREHSISASMARKGAVEALRKVGIEPVLGTTPPPKCYCGRHTLLNSGATVISGKGLVHRLDGCRPAPSLSSIPLPRECRCGDHMLSNRGCSLDDGKGVVHRIDVCAAPAPIYSVRKANARQAEIVSFQTSGERPELAAQFRDIRLAEAALAREKATR